MLAAGMGLTLETALIGAAGNEAAMALYLGGACAMARYVAQARGVSWGQVVEATMGKVDVGQVRRQAERARRMEWVGVVLQTDTLLGLLGLIAELDAQVAGREVGDGRDRADQAGGDDGS